MQQNFIQNIKDFITTAVDKFKSLDKSKKYGIAIGVIAIVLATIFSINYSAKNKYGILFSGLDTYDAANISKALEDKGIETKIEGDSIYVPKGQVDKLRLELSPTITNGSKGFELMDEGSSLSMTDEEFQMKKLRILQGELEKTIKTFPQVEDARVHITQGQQSVFSKENKSGKAAVYVSLKVGSELDENQIKSIISLISASSTNIPKQNVEVIDQSMTLLSEGIYDENGNAIKGNNISASRNAEKELGQELQKSVISMLEPIFGKDKVKVTVNANLNLDTIEKNEVKIDPDTAIKSEYRNENSSGDSAQTGSPVDNNMSNTEDEDYDNSTSIEEEIQYEVGKTEIKTITPSGEVKRITASVAIDGNLTPQEISDVEKVVSSAIGMDTSRGDQLSVVSMTFNGNNENVFEDNRGQQGVQQATLKKIAYVVATAIILIIILVGILIYRSRKAEDEEDYVDEGTDYIAKIVKEKEIEKERELTLEDEIKVIASKNPEEVTKLIKTWLND